MAPNDPGGDRYISPHDHCDWRSPDGQLCVNSGGWPVHLDNDPWRGAWLCEEHMRMAIEARPEFNEGCGCKYCEALTARLSP